MDIDKLIWKDTLEQDESLFIIKEYVRIRKGVEINPVIETRFGKFYSMQQLGLMMELVTTATIWLRMQD